MSVARHLDALLASLFGNISGRVVSAYWPIKAELDLRFWMQALHSHGVKIALPVVETKAAPLAFRAWEPGAKMEKGFWGIPVPAASAAPLTPQISLAPLVGWDASGFRLGYGGGYFDRTLAALKPSPFVIGVGLQAAQIPSIQPLPHDIRLNAIITETGVQYRAG